MSVRRRVAFVEPRVAEDFQAIFSEILDPILVDASALRLRLHAQISPECGSGNLDDQHGRRDDKDDAFQWLDRALEERTTALAYMATSLSWLEPLRSDPRFEELLRRIGLPMSR